LTQSEDAARYAIIRIPKSASLRQVVELILDQFDYEEFSKVRQEFLEAVAEVSPEDAAIRFRGELEISLRELGRQLSEELRARPTDRDVKQKLDHARRFPLLLKDPAFAELFDTRILPAIVQRSVYGRKAIDDEESVDDQPTGFIADHIASLGVVDLSEASREAGLYYRQAFRADGGAGIKVAVDVLNSVLDQSIQRLFHLQSSQGGMTFGEVILEIRRQLLKEGRELVLLVEDFVALVGIQDALGNAMIKEGIDSETEKQTLANMRSAIAVTDGYLSSRDTIMTRAHYEWRVHSQIADEDAILSRVTAMIAAYLNAARWGGSEIQRRYSKNGSIQDKSWLPPFYADEESDSGDLLSAFGMFEGIPLFPFSEQAIRYLAANTLLENGKLVFNPRFVINSILRPILLTERLSFEQANFPATAISAKQLKGQVAEWWEGLEFSSAIRNRLRTVILIWGNNPETLQEVAAIPEAIYHAFQLPVPQVPDSVQPLIKPPKEKKEPVAPISPTREVTDPRVNKIGTTRATLESWANGAELPQSLANTLRKSIASALNLRVDWNAERLRVDGLMPKHISLPGARGEGNLDATVVSALQGEDGVASGRERLELEALIRSELYEKGEAYPEFEEDLARIAALIDRLLPHALKIIRERAKQELKANLWAYLALSRLSGTPSARNVAEKLRKAIDSETPITPLDPDAPEEFKIWKDAQNEAMQIREQLLGYISNLAGCFRGSGSTLQGIDWVRIKDCLKDLPDDISDVKSDLPPDLQTPINRLVGISGQVRVKRVRTKSIDLYGRATEILGNEFDKEELVRALKNLAVKLKETGEWPLAMGPSTKPYLDLLEKFRSTSIKEAFQLVEELSKTEFDASARQLEVIGRLPIEALIVGEHFSVRSKLLIDHVERQLSAEQRTLNVESLAATRQKMRDVLLSTQSCLRSMSQKEVD
jgi:hypothetical protein